MGEVVDINKKSNEAASEVSQEPKVQHANEGKLSYEDLEEVARQLSNQNVALRERIQALELDGLFKRLDYLFRVIEAKAGIFPKEFVKSAADEVQAVMTLPETDDNSGDSGSL